MTQKITITVGILCIILLSQTAAFAKSSSLPKFYVAPNGNDNWSGTLPAPNAKGNDGPLRVPIHSYKPTGGPRGLCRAYVYRSRDDEKTWDEPIAINDPAKLNFANETILFDFGEGKWLAAVRMGKLHFHVSTDDAKTWQYRGPVTKDYQVGGHFLRLRDGRLLLAYGNRIGEDKGVEVIKSDDEGETWSEPIRLLDFQDDGGYPGSVQLLDGQVVTVYYARKIEGHDRHHMGVVIWNPDKSLP